MIDPSAGLELALRNSKGQALHEQMPKAKTPHVQKLLKCTIAATNRQIGECVHVAAQQTIHLGSAIDKATPKWSTKWEK